MNAATSCGPLSDINIDHNQGMQNKWDFLQPLVDQESFSQKCLSNCVLSRRIRGGPSWTAWLTQNNWLLNLMLQTDEYQQNLPPGMIPLFLWHIQSSARFCRADLTLHPVSFASTYFSCSGSEMLPPDIWSVITIISPFARYWVT